MLDGVVGSSAVRLVTAAAVVGVASLFVYRDAHRHGHYYALSATAAVAIAGLVGVGVGGVVGLFVGTGYVMMLYLLSYPSTPAIDSAESPQAADGRPQGDAGENLGGDDDVVSVIRVEVASHETLQELARRYDDVPNDGTESALRSQLRVKALEHVRETVDGADDPEADDGLGDWSEPREPAAAERMRGAVRQRKQERAAEATPSDHGIEEWSAEEPPAETVDEYGAAAWTSESHDPNLRGGDDGADEWTDSGFEAASDHAANGREPGETEGEEGRAEGEEDQAEGEPTEGAADENGVWSTAGETTETPERSAGMVFDNAVEREVEDSDDPEEEPRSDGDSFDGRGELYDGDEEDREPEQSQY